MNCGVLLHNNLLRCNAIIVILVRPTMPCIDLVIEALWRYMLFRFLPCVLDESPVCSYTIIMTHNDDLSKATGNSNKVRLTTLITLSVVSHIF